MRYRLENSGMPKDIPNKISNISSEFDVISPKLDAIISRLDVLLTSFTLRELSNSDRFRDPKRLVGFGHKAYSQSDEDGIIREIISRIGAKSNRFIEVGVGNGLESNTVNLLVQGWRGAWIEGNPEFATCIREKFDSVLLDGRLKVKVSMVTVMAVRYFVRVT